jgi:hypothetical protein
MAAPTTHSSGRRGTQRGAPRESAATEKKIKPDSGAAGTPSFIEPEGRHRMISDAAYFRSERRGFCPGCELDDWLAAEAEVDRALTSGGAPAGSGS